MDLPADVTERMLGRLKLLYADRAEECLDRIRNLADKYAGSLGSVDAGWDQRDVVLITYGDQIRDGDEPTLRVLQRFLTSNGLDEIINTVHLLPFFPYSSDDGFSVIDYRQVDPPLGDWGNVRDLREHVRLMFDFVLNHVSQHSDWFKRYLAGEQPFDNYFIEADPSADLSLVTRPRSLPLLTAFETDRGKRHVWTTFSADQVDLNLAEPELLIEIIDILLFYVQEGARIIRLDAIAYLWKQIGTTCIHLKQTHEVVRLLRDVVEVLAPHVLLLTETNVPHDENVSYLGDGDEAHMVYQFSLPPLLLDALICEDGGALTAWLRGLDSTPAGTTFFNFTASHDGVGVRPLEGLVPPERLDRLVKTVKERGGLVSTKRNPDGTDSPYELNVAYFDALGDADSLEAESHVRRFLASQAIMLSLKGIPGIYFHSLVGTPNFYEGVEESGHARRINRRKYKYDEITAAITQPDSVQSLVYSGYRKLLRTRIEQPAFHPDGGQEVVDFGRKEIVSFRRTSPDASQTILVVANLSGVETTLELPVNQARDLLSDTTVSASTVSLAAYQVAWFVR